MPNHLLAAYFTPLQTATDASEKESSFYKTAFQHSFHSRRKSDQKKGVSLTINSFPHICSGTYKIPTLPILDIYTKPYESIGISSFPDIMGKQGKLVQKNPILFDAFNKIPIHSVSAMKMVPVHRRVSSNIKRVVHPVSNMKDWKKSALIIAARRMANEYSVASSEKMLRTMRHPKWCVPGKAIPGYL